MTDTQPDSDTILAPEGSKKHGEGQGSTLTELFGFQCSFIKTGRNQSIGISIKVPNLCVNIFVVFLLTNILLGQGGVQPHQMTIICMSVKLSQEPVGHSEP